MSSPATDPKPPAEPVVTPPVTPPAPATDPKPTDPAPAQEPDWKAKYEETIAESRKWEQRAKANTEAAEKLAAIEEAAKTEAERQAEKLAAAEAKVAKYEQREQIAAWKDEIVGAAEDLDDAQKAKLRAALRGSTEEELKAHAETLVPLIGQTNGTEPTPTPQTVPTVGRTPAATPNVTLDEQIAAAEQAGNKELVAKLKAMKLGAASPAPTT